MPSATVLAVPFEKFQRQRLRTTREPTVTIQKRGALSLNAAAFEALGSPEFVELLYDRDERLIGFRKLAEDASHAYVVRPAGTHGTNHVISGKAFLRYYDISRDVARRWIAEEQDDILVVDLKQPGTKVTGPSSRPNKGGG
jgi:hypothetical protein